VPVLGGFESFEVIGKTQLFVVFGSQLPLFMQIQCSSFGPIPSFFYQPWARVAHQSRAITSIKKVVKGLRRSGETPGGEGWTAKNCRADPEMQLNITLW